MTILTTLPSLEEMQKHGTKPPYTAEGALLQVGDLCYVVDRHTDENPDAVGMVVGFQKVFWSTTRYWLKPRVMWNDVPNEISVERASILTLICRGKKEDV